MTIGGLLLVLAAAVCHATWNYFVKRLNAGPELVWLFSVVTVVLYLPLAAWFGARVAEFGATELLFIAGSTLLHLAYFLLLQTGTGTCHSSTRSRVRPARCCRPRSR
jgi:drug/metabolite transporter (DMT)-like permease